MKMNYWILLMLLAATSLTMTSCSKDDDDDLGDPAEFLDLTVAADNSSASLSFDVGVYGDSNGSEALGNESISVSIDGGVATLAGYEVVHTAGAAQLTINLSLVGSADGSEVITVSPASESSIYTSAGSAMSASTSTTANLNETGAIGRWVSSGDNVALLLRQTGIDSIYAEFKADNTYLVEAFQADGSRTELTGTFGQEQSGVGNIYNIVLTQNTPNSLISEGIFEVTTENNQTVMTYEVAQTDPNIPGVTPPTADGGFGSTSGGAFGNSNIQTYIRL